MYCDNKEQVKTCLRLSLMAHGFRGIGKTQGILEVIHEDHRGHAIIVVPFSTLMRITRVRYRDLFPDDALPTVCSPSYFLSSLRGQSLPVFVDAFELFEEYKRERMLKALHGRLIGAW